MKVQFQFEDHEIEAAIRAGIKASDLFEIAEQTGRNGMTAADVEQFFRAALNRLFRPLNGGAQ